MTLTTLRAARVATWIALTGATLAARRRPVAVRRATLIVAATLGVAHGAADDALIVDAVGDPRLTRAGVAALYAALALGVFAVAARAPRGARGMLYALTWYHFGSGEAAFAAACRRGPRARWDWLLAGAVPLAAARRAAWPALGAAMIDRTLGDARRGRWADALDVLVPALLFATAPGEQTFLSYFALWHTPRHIALIVERYGRGGTRRARLRRFARAAWPNTVAALVAGIALSRASTDRHGRFIAAVLAITVPHAGAIALLEQRVAADVKR